VKRARISSTCSALRARDLGDSALDALYESTRHVPCRVDPLLAAGERASEATPLSDGAVGRSLCACEEAESEADAPAVVSGSAILARDGDRVRIGEPFEPTGDLHA